MDQSARCSPSIQGTGVVQYASANSRNKEFGRLRIRCSASTLMTALPETPAFSAEAANEILPSLEKSPVADRTLP